ncbi:MAG: anthranilate synthase component I family protein [Nitrospirota bacterium]
MNNAIEIFKRLSDKEKNVCLFKNFIGWNPKEIYKGNSIIDFLKFAKKNKKRKLIGYFSYDIGYKLHNIKPIAKNDLKLPNIYFLAFDKNNYKEILKRKPFKPIKNPKSQNFKPTITKSQYNKAYNRIKHYIKEGDIYQINLTHRLEAKTNIPPRELFLRTLKENPVDHLAYIEGEGFEILSASPERFIKIENRKIETCPVKGTRPRGKTPKEDEKFKKELIESQKEAAELNMITDLLRNDIGKISKAGSVKVEGHRLLSACPTVWHTYSKITGEITKNITPITALISMLPGGSITGCPKKRAIEVIDELEPTTRGIYTGTIGYIDNDELDFNIAIRTIIKKNDKLYLQVGGGIVFDSTNKAEYEESLQKAASFMKIL